MLLKSIELQGFKTFPDKTVLSFENGITAVIGPNGSGKSNISDAVRWVLGEQSTRNLRCSKMEDVIFGGTPVRKAQGFAEVTLTVDNSGRELPFDADTVAVSRRYYRSGESEYLINKTTVRLKDINELFMDTGLGRDGYSMVSQGKIDSIVAARPEDRREIFDEAAGISRFRYRKEESERRLVKAEENLLRLKDIYKELEDRIEPLREQSEKAQQFLTFSEEKRGLEIGLWVDTLEKSGKILREQEDKISVAKNTYDEIGERLSQIGEKTEQYYTRINGCTAKMDEQRAAAAEKDESAAAIRGEISVLENEIRHNADTEERLKTELEGVSAGDLEMTREIEKREALAAEKQAIADEKTREFGTFTEKLLTLRRGVDASSGVLEEYALKLGALTAEISETKLIESSCESSLSELGRAQEEAKAGTAEFTRKKDAGEQAKTQFEEMLSDLEKKVTAAKNAVAGYEIRLENRKKRELQAKEQSDRAQLDMREQERRVRILEELEENLEGFQDSVKKVIAQAEHGSLSGVRGVVSRLLSVPAEYSTAIETALGAAVQNVIVETETDAKRAIGYLKTNNLGRATFLPMNVIRGNLLSEKGLSECAGFVGIASSLCSSKEEYGQIRDYLLGRIVIAEDIDSAVAIARRFQQRFRIVTLDGQVINAGGSMTGGSVARNSGLLGRASEIERIKKKCEILLAQAQKAQEELKAAQEETAAQEAALSAAKGELFSSQEEKYRAEAEYKRVCDELSALKLNLENAALLENQRSERMNALTATMEEAKKKIAETGEAAEKIRAEADEISGKNEEQKKRCTEITLQMQEIRIASLEAQKDVESLRFAVEDIKRRMLDSSGRREALLADIEKAQASSRELLSKAEEKRQEEEAAKKSSGELLLAAQKTAEERARLETETAALRAEEREQTGKRELAGHEVARLEERKLSLQNEYDAIGTRLWEEYEMTRREAEEAAAPIESVPAAKRRLGELKNKIKALGSINVGAIEEYKEVSERYEFLTVQIGDVEKSRDELRKLISGLTGQMKDIFIERFGKISESFEGIFRELFGGGSAQLTLSDPEDILNSGVEIAVCPPGKIVTNMELLSGGEKAMVAISVYFAIMRVSPPPFCVMDEIEAALDEVNVTRFATYLRRMNEKTQFIVITHRRGTMEEADVLYGITMQDEGVSKLLELHPDQIDEAMSKKKG